MLVFMVVKKLKLRLGKRRKVDWKDREGGWMRQGKDQLYI